MIMKRKLGNADLLKSPLRAQYKQSVMFGKVPPDYPDKHYKHIISY